MVITRQCGRTENQIIDCDHRHLFNSPTKSFINASLSEHTLLWQVVIHVVFLFSALAMALVDKTMTQTLITQHQKPPLTNGGSHDRYQTGPGQSSPTLSSASVIAIA